MSTNPSSSSSSEDINPSLILSEDLPSSSSSSKDINPSSFSSKDTNPPTILSLRSSDNETFDIRESVAKQSGVLKLMIEDGCFQGEIPLTNVPGRILSKVIDWCNKHEEEEDGKQKMSDEEMKMWEKEFISTLSSNDDLLQMLLASNYLNVKPLLDCACQQAADFIKDKKPEQVREIFNIENDFTPEEEAEVRRENAWAFQ